MSFLNTGYSATVAARLTQKGRHAIASGNFNVSYFAVGDSEYNYTGLTTQSVLEPFDKDINVKYPLWYTNGSTFFGIPINNSITSSCRNVMSGDTSWTSNVVWEKNPIGYTTTGFTYFPNSKYLGTKSFFGYSSSSGQTTNTGTTIVNSIGNIVTISPEEQKAIAILHYSGGTDVDSFFKYDDYISTFTGVTSPNTKTDRQYFSVVIPSLKYHRNTGTTFYMTTSEPKTIVSNSNGRSTIDYMDLIDSTGNTANRVGKIFHNHKLIVIDDEEIAITLDSASNRNYTLPAPFVNTLVSNSDPILSLTTGQTLWVTYTLDTTKLPCNYFMKVTGSSNSEVVTIQFNTGSTTDFNYLNNGYIASHFKVLYQFTTGGTPIENHWNIIDYTAEAGGPLLPNLKTGYTFTLNQSKIASGTSYSSPLTNFGNTGTTFGTVNLVRASDIEEMTFDLNLPFGTFGDKLSQNPTWIDFNTSGYPYMTEVALLNNNKETLVMGKLAAPIQRTGAQILSVKIDF
jgi:hypothetical protein